MQAPISLLTRREISAKLSADLRLEFRLKGPADRAAKCWATGDQFNPSFKKHVAAEGKPLSLLMVIALVMPERVFYIAPAPNVPKHEELNDL